MAIIFLASAFAVWNPSLNIMISAIRVKSGTIIDTGRTIAFRLSGSSDRPAYLLERVQRGLERFREV
eukprot:1867434-Pyramimonas_sp.AAC.1